MMRKIKFTQPRYIIPLIILPFIFIFYFLFKSDDVKAAGPVGDIEIEGINPNLPNASDNIESLSRLEAYQKALNKKRINTGMNELEDESYNRRLSVDDQGNYRKDSIKTAFEKAAERRRLAAEKADASRKKLMELTQGRKSASGSPGTPKKRTAASKSQSEMDEFKAQMRYLDSMQNPEKYEVQETEEERFAHKISKNKSEESQYFNTIKRNKDETMITAILDEGIKAWEGSRVRIRLLEPIFIDGNLLEKGQYLYGICSGFKQQRLLVEVSSVVIRDQIYPLDISLYDNDGLEGIYIPASSFRTFTKELGAQSSQAGSLRVTDDSPRNNTQVLYQSLSNAVRSSSRAVQRALRKNKARLKYNTEVYLVNNNTK